MYAGIDKTVAVDDAIKSATEYVMSTDRSVYDPFFRVAETYIGINGGIMGGTAGEILLVAHRAGIPPEPSRDSFGYTVYIDPAACNPVNWTRTLVDQLFAVNSPLSARIGMTTAVYRREFNININTRPCVKILVLSPFRDKMQFVKTAKPAKVQGFYGGKVHVMDVEMLLASIYRGLHNPNVAADWPELARREASLARTVVSDVHRKVFGGGEYSKIPWFELSGVIWIGDPAVTFHDTRASGGNPPATFDDNWRPQIITDHDPDTIINMVEKIIPRIGGRKLTYLTTTPGLVGDPQLTKTTIYAESRGKRTSLLDVYNVTTYDIVPYIEHDGIRYASVWPTLRMLFSDLWILRSIGKSDCISARITRLLDGITRVRTAAWSDLVRASDIALYTGSPLSDDDARRKLISEGQRIAPYYPAKIKKGGIESELCQLHITPIIGAFGERVDPIVYMSEFLPPNSAIIPYLGKYKHALLVRSNINVSADIVDRISPVCCVDDGLDLFTALADAPADTYDFVHLAGVLHHSTARLTDISAELKRIAPTATIIITDITECPSGLETIGIISRPTTELSTVAITGSMSAQGYTKLMEKKENGIILVFRG